MVLISVSRPVSTTKCHTLGLTLPNGWIDYWLDHPMQCCPFCYATKCRLCCSIILTKWRLRVIDSFITCAPRTLSSLYNLFLGCKEFLSDLCGRESYLFREINGYFNLTWQQNLENLIILVALDAAQNLLMDCKKLWSVLSIWELPWGISSLSWVTLSTANRDIKSTRQLRCNGRRRRVGLHLATYNSV